MTDQPVLYIEPGDRDGIPVDVFTTIAALVSAAYPNALMGPGRFGNRGFGLILPERPKAKRVTKKAVAAAKVEPDPDADMGILGWDGESLRTVLPEKLSRYLAEVVYSWLSSVEGASNYLEQTMTHPDHPGKQLVMIAAWSEGQTPHELRQKAEARAEKAEAALASKPTAEQVWQALHGTDEPWGGCADSERVGRIMALFEAR